MKTLHALPLALALATASVAAPAVAEEAPSRIEVGQQAPSFALQASDGTTHSLDTLRGEKNLLMIFFRGTW